MRQNGWQLADFGISTAGTAKRLIATKDARGTERYRAPEILFSEPSVPSYTNKVDIWGLGLILYQLFTGKNAFQSDFDVRQYRSDGICPQISSSSSTAVFDSIAKTALAFPDVIFDMLQKAACSVLSINSGVLAVKTSHLQPSRRIVINKFLEWLLQRDPTMRPTIEQVCIFVGANYIASTLEKSSVESNCSFSLLSHSLMGRHILIYTWLG
jgi:serine/threonine protein kinase